MRSRAFAQVDVFTTTPYCGNPVAVVLDGAGLDTAQMQAFARWTNLSETTFVLPPSDQARAAGAHYRLRIFTPAAELPFAGHPTLGSCHAWLRSQTGGAAQPKQSARQLESDPDYFVQECGVGLVRIRRERGRLAFAAPPLLRSGPLDEAEVQLIARGLGVARSDIVRHAWCDNGPKWRAVMLQSAAQVLALKPDAQVLQGLYTGVVAASAAGGAAQAVDADPTRGKVGVVASATSMQTTPCASEDAPAFEVRAFFPNGSGMGEDPVTGSLNAGIAQWLIDAGLAPDRYVAAQGTALGRAGRVHVARDGADIWVGGDCVSRIEGSVTL